jgi:hypothetical protein
MNKPLNLIRDLGGADEAARARRTELVRETRAALSQNESLAARTKRREENADEWARWFKRRMDEVGCADPVQLLPDAFARLQQITADRVATAVSELKKAMCGALK